MDEMDRIKETKKRLDAVSPTFCGAKWNDVTIHLLNGHTHSCHHPNIHPIPLDELAADPSALHNTSLKKLQRKMQLEGQRPLDCDYCWRIEDLPGEHYSDRIMKSNAAHTRDLIEHFGGLSWDTNVNPAYVEVSFSSACNFKCSYCGPHVSSKWVEEVKQHGPYPTTTRFGDIDTLRRRGQMPFRENEYNPFVEAWWKWWPTLYPTLEVFRITGGEPLLSKHTFRVLDWIIEHPNPNLGLAINSNLGVPDHLIDLLIEKLNHITENKKVKYVQVFTSIDTWGKEAEYQRHGLDIAQFERNVHKIFQGCPLSQVILMCTFNCLSVFNFDKLLDFVVDIKRWYFNPDRFYKNPMSLDINFLRWPEHQTVKVFDGRFADIMHSHLAHMEAKSEKALGYYKGFFEFEIEKMRRLVKYYEEPSNPDWLKVQQVDFVRFFREHDRRRGTDLLTVFPQLADFVTTIEKSL